MAAALDRAEALSDVGRDRAALDLLLPLLAQEPDHPLLVVECARLLMSSGTQDGLDEGLPARPSGGGSRPAGRGRPVRPRPRPHHEPAALARGRRVTEQAVATRTARPGRLARPRPGAQGHGGRQADHARAAAERAVQLAPGGRGCRAAARRRWRSTSSTRSTRQAAAEVARAGGEGARPWIPMNADAHVLRAKADFDGTSGDRGRRPTSRPPGSTRPTAEALAGADDELTFPLRLGFWLMWLLVVVQAVLLVLGVDWGLVPRCGGARAGAAARVGRVPGGAAARPPPDPARTAGSTLSCWVSASACSSASRSSGCPTRDTLPWVGPRRLRRRAGRGRRALPGAAPSPAASPRRLTCVVTYRCRRVSRAGARPARRRRGSRAARTSAPTARSG